MVNILLDLIYGFLKILFQSSLCSPIVLLVAITNRFDCGKKVCIIKLLNCYIFEYVLFTNKLNR